MVGWVHQGFIYKGFHSTSTDVVICLYLKSVLHREVAAGVVELVETHLDTLAGKVSFGEEVEESESVNVVEKVVDLELLERESEDRRLLLE